MKLIALLGLLLSLVLLPAQLVISAELEKSGFSDAFDVAAWGDNYLIRTTRQSVLPFDQNDELLFANVEGLLYFSESFNPYVRESDFTTTDITALTDSTAVALATNPGGDSLSRARLTRFNEFGDTLLTRDLVTEGISPYSLHSSGDSILFFVESSGNGDFIVRSVTGDFVDRFAVTFSDEVADLTFRTAYADANGGFLVLYERLIAVAGSQTERDQVVVRVGLDGVIISERTVADLRRVSIINNGYTSVRPIGQNGVAILEGLSTPDLGCVTATCEDEGGYLHIYRDESSPREFYRLDFAPFGMELLPDGNLFVFGATTILGNGSKGVLFNPTGWPDGNRIHVLNDPNATGQEPVAYNRIYGMDVADNGDLVGTGVIAYGETNRVEESHWLFRMGPSGCFTADCSDLAENPGDLVPVTNLPQNLSIKAQPNPFTNQLNFLPSENQAGAQVTVSLRDVTGRLLRRGYLGEGLQWSTEDLAPGLYMATFTSGSQRATVKLVKR